MVLFLTFKCMNILERFSGKIECDMLSWARRGRGGFTPLKGLVIGEGGGLN